ncbi:Phage small terminase subunit [Methylomagnum ishizawai]|uniref:Phage small terminase subunit n=1 Tax=Methylomagnum ishizawai TaxID=1760988 RepID=A0A1Y6CVJ7_9GAMM|nr:phage terminase small subunit [Methylomagnum ishizawai]SMF94421.1 Phage small terminase subunit [Methylomagnum ishizawai]
MNPLSRIAAKRREQKAQAQAKPKAQVPAPAHLNPLARIAAKRREQKAQDEAMPPAQAPTRRNRLPPANAQRNAPPEAAPEPIAADEASPVALGHIAQYQAAVDAHIAAMAPMKDLTERQAYKAATALPEIMPFVDGYIDNGDRYPNSVAVQAMIWLFDVGNIGRALSLAFRLIAQGIHPMPNRFDRDMRTFVCDALYDWASEQLKAGQDAAPYLPQLLFAIEANKWPLHPAVISKLYVMAAKHLERLQLFGEAASACMRAMEANPEGHGCKGLYARCLQAQKLADQASA